MIHAYPDARRYHERRIFLRLAAGRFAGLAINIRRRARLGTKHPHP